MSLFPRTKCLSLVNEAAYSVAAASLLPHLFDVAIVSHNVLELESTEEKEVSQTRFSKRVSRTRHLSLSFQLRLLRSLLDEIVLTTLVLLMTLFYDIPHLVSLLRQDIVFQSYPPKVGW